PKGWRDELMGVRSKIRSHLEEGDESGARDGNGDGRNGEDTQIDEERRRENRKDEEKRGSLERVGRTEVQKKGGREREDSRDETDEEGAPPKIARKLSQVEPAKADFLGWEGEKIDQHPSRESHRDEGERG